MHAWRTFVEITSAKPGRWLGLLAILVGAFLLAETHPSRLYILLWVALCGIAVVRMIGIVTGGLALSSPRHATRKQGTAVKSGIVVLVLMGMAAAIVSRHSGLIASSYFVLLALVWAFSVMFPR